MQPSTHTSHCSGTPPQHNGGRELANDGAADDPVRSMVIELISKSMTVDDVVILDEHEFTRDLQMTSVEIIDLLCSLEEHYETEIDEAEVFPIETVGELVAFVQGATTGSA